MLPLTSSSHNIMEGQKPSFCCKHQFGQALGSCPPECFLSILRNAFSVQLLADGCFSWYAQQSLNADISAVLANTMISDGNQSLKSILFKKGGFNWVNAGPKRVPEYIVFCFCDVYRPSYWPYIWHTERSWSQRWQHWQKLGIPSIDRRWGPKVKLSYLKQTEIPFHVYSKYATIFPLIKI